MTGWPRTGSGTNSSGGAQMKAKPLPTSSGASSMKSRQNRMRGAPISAGYISRPPKTIGPTGWSRKWKAVTTPKLPPPPRTAQNRSGFSSSEATTWRPSAVTISARKRLSQVNPSLRSSQPLPLPRASPPIPVSDTRPPVTASPCAWVAASSSPQVSPASARTVALGTSMSMPFMPRRSTHTPSLQTADPVTPWPPP